MGRKVLLLAAFAALAVFVFGGGPVGAHPDPHHPDGETLHRDCTWTVDKAVNHGHDITQFVGQEPFTVTYTITLKATCADSHHVLADESHHSPNGHLHGPDHVVNECVVVDDTFAGGPQDATVCTTASNTFVFTYQRTFGGLECGDHSFENTGTVTEPSHQSHPDHPLSDSVTINIRVLCDHGCTLTQGYWKAHSDRGPAPFDATWNLLGDVDGDTSFEQESENFFLSGQTWYQVFWTSPSGGNAYYILAHQYMAAVLNILGGASSTTAVNTALSSAVTFFSTYTPGQAGALGKKSAARQGALAAATTLGNYNTGLIGPGHCDDDHNTSALN